MTDELENIIYISVPEELERSIGDFQIDPEIMLPVETVGGADKWDIQDLSWEQILAGMLKILAYEPDHDDVEYYREFVLTIRPDIIDELTETAIIKARNRDFDIAEEIFRALIGLQPAAQRPLINLALLYEERATALSQASDEEAAQEDIERAFEMYREIMEADEILPEAHLNAGHFYLRQRSYERARTHLQAYIEAGEDEEKQREARKIVAEIDSQNLLDTLFKEAYDFIRMGREEEGISRIRTFLDSNPGVWNGWFLLGWGLRRLSRYDEAAQAFEKALDTGPRQADTLNELAICMMELGNLDRARVLLTEALTGEPENAKIISNLGIVSLKSGQAAEAEAYFTTVLDIAPDDKVARAYLDQLSDN